MVLGSCTGAIFGGWKCEQFGRKATLLFDSFVLFLGTILTGASPNFETLLISRVILGHSIASAMTAIPAYTSEISQPGIRSVTGCFNVACFTFGSSFTVFIGKNFKICTVNIAYFELGPVSNERPCNFRFHEFLNQKIREYP